MIIITMQNDKQIKLEMDRVNAPNTVNNFVYLASKGYYNGLIFHRVIKGFMIQGGDPEGTGYGGSGNPIEGEFEKNGYENNISHKKGVISMARSQSFNSASSQFFIVQADDDSIKKALDGYYAAFGHVTKGIEIVDAIAKDALVVDNNGTVVKENQPVIEKIVVKKK